MFQFSNAYLQGTFQLFFISFNFGGGGQIKKVVCFQIIIYNVHFNSFSFQLIFFGWKINLKLNFQTIIYNVHSILFIF